MSFGIPRKELLRVLADAMFVPEEKRSALLGRFQHLQRLTLIEGINPGRGKAAEYSADQVTIIGMAFQFLQVGLSPERAVQILRSNRLAIYNSVGLLFRGDRSINGSYLILDPAVLTPTLHHDTTDWGERTFICAPREALSQIIDNYFGGGGFDLPRIVIISITGMIETIVNVMDPVPKDADYPHIGSLGQEFLESLCSWHREIGEKIGNS